MGGKDSSNARRRYTVIGDSPSRGKVLIKVSKGDKLGSGMGEYLARNYANSELIVEEGGHISSIYTLNEDIARPI